MQNLVNMRKAMHKTQQEAADYLGISRQAYSNYEAGKREPDFETLLKLGEYFDCSVDYLLGKTSKSSGIKIPVLGEVRAGLPIEAVENIIDYEEIDAELARGGEYFALRIVGDSMEPRIREGDVVIVRKQPDIESGEIGIVLVNGDSATVKKVVKHEDGISLIAYNTAAYPPHFYTKKEISTLPVTIIGKVVELRAKF